MLHQQWVTWYTYIHNTKFLISHRMIYVFEQRMRNSHTLGSTKVFPLISENIPRPGLLPFIAK